MEAVMRLRNPDFITLYTHENDTKTVPGTQAAHGDAFVDLTEADGALTLRLTADLTPVRYHWYEVSNDKCRKAARI